MKLLATIFSIFFMTTISFGQDADIIQPIKDLFDGMRAGDATLISSAFTTDAVLETYTSIEGETKVESTLAANFVKAAGQVHDPIWNEVIWSYEVKRDGPLAHVWTEYTFYLGSQRLHCGVNAFQMRRQNGFWKIARVTDTRREENCRELPDEGSPEKLLQNEIEKEVWGTFKEAYSNFDAELMNSIHSDDVIRATRHSIFVGGAYKKKNIERYEDSKARGDQRFINFKFDLRKATDSHAIETGVYKVTSTRDGVTQDFYGFFHVILRKEDGGWKIIYDWDSDTVNGFKVNADWWK
jgi:ketosteroid isomerase-like protein